MRLFKYSGKLENTLSNLTKMKHISVDEYIMKSGKWQQTLNMLRELMVSLNMEETVKWGTPVYCIKGKNVVGIGSFKAYTGLWFYQGVFLNDRYKKLINASEEETRALRQWRFRSADEIEEDLDIIIEYVKEAIENSKKGKEIKPIKNKPFDVPEELKQAMKNNPDLKKSYNLLSHSKRRDYARYIDQAKRNETRSKRLDKCIPLILEGKGLMDQYK